ncbi:MAG: F0F1 ATP synthase subunit epsilon [Desulfurivibrionaceae bacterium]|jgi:F-type H+-transporting ATPase subunit epsilon|nr:F0F1 ATP synthase subunit epsilon [Pseudomonadota bacterium]MBU4230464.1 F0F1 ATP synthase subunit epsilon [Pseudomonadota bacterium]MBU4412385.1 F0F1 ATP synthase subunit epsilon [Pseudomonadota bacterium]MCG2822230.1 F0F1 ATP synthase subunit epsilon [Desulfobulbaceae bacterium]MDP2757784.1 F0F1 ATP synthase subunit epsilon [Desulfurivibrionaceae bacterium]
MAEKLKLEVVTPKGAVVSKEVDIVTAPGYGGEFGVLANHAPFLSTIKTGVLTYKTGAQEETLMVSGGFCEVSNNKLTFLVESAERGADIDVERAMRAKERAEKRLAEAQAQKEKFDRTRAEAALQRALSRLKVAERRKPS